jgi:predicted lipid-binding transport protein (Tim44 family)
MPRLLLLLAFLAFGLPAAAQTAVPAPRQAPSTITLPQVQLPPMPEVSAGHAAALGAGLFAGALAGSALIQGGFFGAAIGAIAGVTIGNWAWQEHGLED